MTTPRKDAKLKVLSRSLVKRTLDEGDSWCIYNIRCREEAEKVLAFIVQDCRETDVTFELQSPQQLAIYTPTHNQWRTVRIKFVNANACTSPNWHCYCSKTQ
jgi:predicted RNA-binding protein with PUA-like domain